MQSGIDSLLPPGAPAGPSLEVELISAHARVSGSVHLNKYTRLSDLLNLQGAVISVFDPVILDPAGISAAANSPRLDVQLDELTLVVDRSNYIPPVDHQQAIEKKSHHMMAITDAHLIFGTFFTYPSAEPPAYLVADDPRWIPLADVTVRSLVDRKIEFRSAFAVLNRRHIVSTTTL